MCLYTWRTKSVKLQITAYVAPIFLNRTFFIFLQCLNPEKNAKNANSTHFYAVSKSKSGFHLRKLKLVISLQKLNFGHKLDF